jgi:hypothetical protein
MVVVSWELVEVDVVVIGHCCCENYSSPPRYRYHYHHSRHGPCFHIPQDGHTDVSILVNYVPYRHIDLIDFLFVAVMLIGQGKGYHLSFVIVAAAADVSSMMMIDPR